MSRKSTLALILTLVAFSLLTSSCTVEDAQASPESAEKTNKTVPMAQEPDSKVEDPSEPSNAETQPQEKAPARGTLFSHGVHVSGTALAVRESYLSAEVPGIIEKIKVDRGDHVKKNQVLLELDSSGYQLGVAQAKAGLDAAKAQEEQLRTEIDRVKELLKSGAAPTATLDQLSARSKGAGANVRMSEAGLRRAKKSLADSLVRAPYDGVITDILKQVGENAPSMPPTMLLKIVDTSSLEVQAFVPEGAAAHVMEGGEAHVRIDSVDADLTGEIIFVSSSITPQTRTFEVRIKLDNPDGKIKAGSFARVTIPTPSAHTDR